MDDQQDQRSVSLAAPRRPEHIKKYKYYKTSQLKSRRGIRIDEADLQCI